MIENFIYKLGSRKFLLAVAAFLTAIDQHQTVVAGAVAAIYILAEAAVDHKGA